MLRLADASRPFGDQVGGVASDCRERKLEGQRSPVVHDRVCGARGLERDD